MEKYIYETMTLDLEPEKLSKGFAKVNKTISQISPRPQTQCSEGEIILIQTIIMTKKRLLFSKRIQRNHPYITSAHFWTFSDQSTMSALIQY